MLTGETFFAINRQLCYESIAIYGEVVNSGENRIHKTINKFKAIMSLLQKGYFHPPKGKKSARNDRPS